MYDYRAAVTDVLAFDCEPQLAQFADTKLASDVELTHFRRNGIDVCARVLALNSELIEEGECFHLEGEVGPALKAPVDLLGCNGRSALGFSHALVLTQRAPSSVEGKGSHIFPPLDTSSRAERSAGKSLGGPRGGPMRGTLDHQSNVPP